MASCLWRSHGSHRDRARSITGPTVLEKTEPTQEQLSEVIKQFVNYAYREELRADMPKGARPEAVAQLFAPEDE
jgi:hypothetical protein